MAFPTNTSLGSPDLRELCCPSCDATARLSVRFAGRRVRCPSCRAEFRVAEDMSRLISQRKPRASRPLPAPETGRSKSSPEPEENRQHRRAWVLWSIVGGAAVLLIAAIGGIVWAVSGPGEVAEDIVTLTADSGDGRPNPDRKPADAANRDDRPAHPPKPQPAKGSPFVQLNTFDANKLKGRAAASPAAALKESTTVKADQAQLIDVLTELAERHKLPIVIDEKALTDEGIPLRMPVSIDVAKVPLEDAFEALLSPLLLTHVLPDKNAKAVVVTSLVKASGSSANRLLAGGFDNPNPPGLPPKQRPVKRTPKRRPRAKPKTKGKAKPKPGPSPQAAYQQGRRLLADRKIDEAIREFSRAISKRRNFPEAIYQRGYAYLLKQENRRALNDFSRVIALSRNHVAAYSSRATIYQRLGYSQHARADRIKALQLKRRRTTAPRRRTRKRKRKK